MKALSLTRLSWLGVPLLVLVLPGARIEAQSTDITLPTRWQVSYAPVYTESFENAHPGVLLQSPSSPPRSINSAVITTDQSLVLAGSESARIGWFGKLVTVPSVWPLAGGNTYIVEFQYRILNIGTAADILHLDLQPVGTANEQSQVNFAHMNLNVPTTGTFSAGGYLPGSATYVLTITAQQQTDIVIDNLTIYQQNAIPTTTTPASWARLETLPFPRLGKNELGTYSAYVFNGSSAPDLYTLSYIENTMAFFDLQFGILTYAQTQRPDEIMTARQLNPNAILLPYRISEEEPTDTNPQIMGAFTNSNVSLDYQFHQTFSSDWYLRDSKGNIVLEAPIYPTGAVVNLSSFAPVINGNTYTTLLVNWLNTKVFPSGAWDGIYFDNLFGDINHFIPNYQDPSLIDVDIQRNGTRSTPAQVSEMTRTGATAILKLLRETILDQQLIIGNVGAPGLDPYVNGFLFECVNYRWNPRGTSHFSPMSWRAAFDAYRGYQATMRRPRTNALQGCGETYNYHGGVGYPLPTAADLVSHRFTMGTALLGDGFYAFDLQGGTSPPLWYDEYSVNSAGVATQDVNAKGYLGQALSDATELAGPATVALQDGFEGAALSSAWTSGAPAKTSVTISQNAGHAISGSGSLVLRNPNHTQKDSVGISTNPQVVQFTAGSSYLLTFDWKILDTVDTLLGAAISTDPSQPLDVYTAPGKVAGDHGTAHLPFTIPSDGPWSASIYVVNGGEVAIDDVTITQGNVGPWRRDFEKGFVLVNPLAHPYTFSASDLAGPLQRTGVHRIRGTQATDVNNGQLVTGGLTLNSFDAILMLADHIAAPPVSTTPPVVKGVVSAGAFGAFSNVSPGSWVEIYGSNLSVTTRSWTSADFNGARAPTSLDGVSVLIGGRPAYISYISPTQINALVASDAAIGPMQLIVSGPTGASSPDLITVQPTQPGMLAPPSFQVGGIQYAAAIFPDGRTFALPTGAIPGVPSRPATSGDVIILYGVGFGPVSPNLLAGTLVGASNSLANSFQIQIGNTPATIQYAGLAPQATGLYQFNITVPNVPAGSAVPVTFDLGGTPGAQTFYLAVQN